MLLEQLAEPASALFLPADRWPDRLLAEAWLEGVRNSAHDSVCACSADEVVDATIEHGRRIHNMEASRDQVLAVLGAGQPDEPADLTA